MKAFGLVAAAVSLAAFAAPVRAAVFTITGSSSSFSFTLPDAPTQYYSGGELQYFDVAAPSGSHLLTVNLNNPSNANPRGLTLHIEDQDTGDTLYDLYGAQLYSGSLAAPTFAQTSYQLTTRRNGGGLTYTLAIGSGAAAVPEPASWAMMIGGFGLVGGALRRRGAKLAGLHPAA